MFPTEVVPMEVVVAEGLAGVEQEAVVGLGEVIVTHLLLLIVAQQRSMLQDLRGKTRMKFWLILL